MTFELVSTSDATPDQVPTGQVIATRKLFLQQRSDANVPRDEDGQAVTKPEPERSADFHSDHYGQRFEIPFFDKRSPDAEFRGGRVLNYYRDEIPEKAQEALKKFLGADAALLEHLQAMQEGRRGSGGQFSGLYPLRGIRGLHLMDLHRAMGDWVRFPMFSWEDTWNPDHHLIRPYSA